MSKEQSKREKITGQMRHMVITHTMNMTSTTIIKMINPFTTLMEMINTFTTRMEIIHILTTILIIKLATNDAGEILERVDIINMSSVSMKLFILIAGLEAVLDPSCFQAVGQEINLKGSELLPKPETYIIISRKVITF